MIEETKNRKGRACYLFEATFEYFLSLMLEGAYVAKVGTALGMTDGMIGVVTSLSNLGAAFGIFALFFSPNRKIKKTVFLYHTVNQLFFSLTWLIPLWGLPQQLKWAAFAFFLLGGHILSHIISSPKIAWYMEMVDDRKRGVFTARKERMSLVLGMIFSFCMGTVIDRCEAEGNTEKAFLIGGVTMLGITLLHSLTLLLTPERQEVKEGESAPRFFETVRTLMAKKEFRSVLLLTIACKITLSVSTPFYGTYLVNDLGCSMVFIAVVDIVYALVRCVASVFLGKLADRTSFRVMFRTAAIFCCLAYLTMGFATPTTGKFVYVLYRGVFLGIFWGGYNSSLINMVYDTVERSDRTYAYALYSTLAGIVGFLTSLAVSPLVTRFQGERAVIFGSTFSIQQILSVVAAFFALCIWLAVKKKDKRSVIASASDER